MDKAMDERWRNVKWRRLALASAVLAAAAGSTVAGTVWAAQTTPPPGTAQPKAPAADDLPLTAVGSYLSARFAEQIEDTPAALRFLSRALADNPTDPGLLGDDFALLLSAGRIDDALAVANRIGHSSTESAVAGVLLVAADIAAGHDDAAATRLAAMPRNGLDAHLVPLLLAWAQAAGKHYTEAQATLASVGTTPGFVALRELQSGMIAELAGDRATADSAYQSVLSKDPSLRVVETVGAYYRRTGRVDLARKIYAGFGIDHDNGLLTPDLDKSLATPPPPLTAQQGMALALFDFASALHQEGASDLAMLYARISLYLSPQLDLCRLLAGDILDVRGRDSDALAEYRQVKGDKGLVWLAALRQVDELKKMDRLPEAIDMLRTLVAERPDRVDSLLDLGETYRDAGRYDEAIATFNKALAQVKTVGPQQWGLFYARGLTYDKMGNWSKAEPDLIKAEQLNPNQPFLLNYLGYSWVDRGIKLDQAKIMIERAVAMRPNDGFIIDSLGWALYKQGDYAGAVTQLEKAVELKPLDPTLNEHLGDIYWQLGRHREARFQWQRALNESDDKTQVGALQRKLNEGLPKRQGTGVLN